MDCRTPKVYTSMDATPPKDRVRGDQTADPTLIGLHTEIMRAFNWFNARHWNNELPTPIVSFFPQPPNGNRLGHFWANTWREHDREERRDEVIFYADKCLQQGINQVLQTLLHEMVHLWQKTKGKPGKDNHHNRAWHAEAKRVGLQTEGPKGFTTATDEFNARLREFAPRVEACPWRSPPTRQKGKMILWMCSCGIKIRAGRRDIDIRCNLCEEDFAVVE